MKAKCKESDKKKTGGGPALKLLPAEEVVLDKLRDKPQLIGIVGGVESDSVKISEPAQVPSTSAQQDVSDAETPFKESTIVEGKVTHTPCLDDISTQQIRPRKDKKRESPHDELYLLEVKRAAVEVELFQQKLLHEKQIIANAQELFTLNKEKLLNDIAQDKALFQLRSKAIETQLKNSFADDFLSLES